MLEYVAVLRPTIMYSSIPTNAPVSPPWLSAGRRRYKLPLFFPEDKRNGTVPSTMFTLGKEVPRRSAFKFSKTSRRTLIDHLILRIKRAPSPEVPFEQDDSSIIRASCPAFLSPEDFQLRCRPTSPPWQELWPTKSPSQSIFIFNATSTSDDQFLMRSRHWSPSATFFWILASMDLSRR